MPPKVKFQKEEIINAAVAITREKGADSLTARETAARLGVSTAPIFTYFDTMDQLKGEVYDFAKRLYREYILRGLAEPIPNLGVGRQYIRFAKEEPELYKLLYLTKSAGEAGGAMEALHLSQELVRDSVMKTYNMDADTADRYFRDLWLVAFSFATLIVTDECPYTEEEISAVFTEVSLSICKAYKEIPGLPVGDFDRDAIFKKLVETKPEAQRDAIRLRPYKACDAETIVSWIGDEVSFRKWCADRYDRYPITADDMNRHYNDFADSDSFCQFTAFDGSGIVGHMIMRFTDDEKKVLRFGFIIVDSQKRGMGCGRRMLKAAVKYAFEILGAEKLTLGVFENNEAALRCYKSVGFTEVEQSKTEVFPIFGEEWKCIELELRR